MAGFADLPNEFVLEVLEMVLPEDLEKLRPNVKTCIFNSKAGPGVPSTVDQTPQKIFLAVIYHRSKDYTLKSVMDFQLDPSQLYSKPYSMIVASVTILGKSY